MKQWLFRLSVLLMACAALPALADSISMDTIHDAATRTGDLSRQVLIMVFGNVVNDPLNPGDASMLGTMFFVLTAIISATATFWFLFITVKRIGKTGHKGEVFDGGFTAMALLSTLMGFFSMVPLPSGWSLLQLLIIWAASIFGVGSANLLTDAVTDSILNGDSVVVQPVAPQTADAARGLFEAYVCMEAVNSELQGMYNTSGSTDTPMMTERPLDQSAGDGIVISNGSAQCGSARLPPLQDSSTSAFTFGITFDTSTLQAAQHNAFITLQNTLVQDAVNYVNAFNSIQQSGSGTLPDAEAYIQNAAQAYETTLTQAISSQGGAQNLQNQVVTQLKQYGWLSLGAWYQAIATANTKTNDVAKMVPVVTGPSHQGDLGASALYAQIDTAYRAQQQNSTWTQPLGSTEVTATTDSKAIAAIAHAKTPDEAMADLLPWGGQWFANYLATMKFGQTDTDFSTQMNPMLKMKALGDYTLDGAETTFALFAAARTAVAVLDGKNLAAAITNAFTADGDTANGILEAISPLVYFLVALLFSIGFSLSIYLPFIPFIYWMTGIASWIVCVLIAVVAAPLWAWTHIGTESDKGSRALYGWVYLIDVMIRPTIMVFAFFFASAVIVAVGTVLNLLIAPAIASVQNNSVTGVVSIVGILLIYSRICTTAVSSLFSLQVVLPDFVIAWLGGREGIKMMNDMVDSTRNLFASFGAGAGHTPGLKAMAQKDNGPGNEDGFK
jgi:conjugal transfer/type IV secretion protein DotA/TraY